MKQKDAFERNQKSVVNRAAAPRHNRSDAAVHKAERKQRENLYAGELVNDDAPLQGEGGGGRWGGGASACMSHVTRCKGRYPSITGGARGDIVKLLIKV